MEDRIVFHIDFDYFYAQCEEIRRPELKTRPVAVCVFSDRGGDSGAVATANYIARKLGVKSGVPIRQAKSKLESKPDAAFLPVDFDYYSKVSQDAMKMISSFADVFEYVGRDEAYLDVTDRTSGDYKVAAHLAQQIKNEIRGNVGLTSSIGVTPNKLLSKIASDYKKPDGLTVVQPETVEEFLDPLKIGDIPGIGKKTGEVLGRMGAKTIRDLRQLDVFVLQQQFGRKTGTYIHNASMGKDFEPVAEKEANIQYSRIVTLKRDSKEFDFMASSLKSLCGEVHAIVVRDGRLFKSVGVQLFQSDMSQKTKSRTLRNPTSSLEELERNAVQLLADALVGQEKTVRRIGVRVSELSEASGQRSMDGYL